MEGEYSYDSLDGSQADTCRILELQHGEDEAPIVGNLIHARLDDRPAYEAVSYVWGSLEKLHVINCNGRQLPITHNLRDALLRIRLPDRPRRIWVDSICIDQVNLTEKSHQVSLMGKIYRKASRVLICLGTDDEGHAKDSISLVQDVSSMIQDTLGHYGQELDTFPYPSPDDPLPHDRRWVSLSAMLARPWFQRGWVVQEAALASEALVLWGDAECSWTALMNTWFWSLSRGFAQFVDERLSHIGMVHLLLHLWKGTSKSYLRALYRHEEAETKISVPFVMEAARNLHLTNPEDRVFAFLEIIEQLSRSNFHFQADCTKAPEAVYTEFAFKYLEATHDLSLLRCVQHTHSSIKSNVPSWVPLWDVNQCDMTEDPLGRRRSSRSKSSLHFTLGDQTGTPNLRLKAILFDTVRLSSERLDLRTVEDVVRLCRHMSPPFGATQNVPSLKEKPVDLERLLWALHSSWHTRGEREGWNEQLLAYRQYVLDCLLPNRPENMAGIVKHRSDLSPCTLGILHEVDARKFQNGTSGLSIHFVKVSHEVVSLWSQPHLTTTVSPLTLRKSRISVYSYPQRGELSSYGQWMVTITIKSWVRLT